MSARGLCSWLVRCIMLMLCGCAPSLASPIVLSPLQSSYAVGDQVDILEDVAGQWVLADVLQGPVSRLFKPSSQLNPNFGSTNSTYWVRLVVVGDSAAAEPWLFEIGNPTLDSIQAYLPDPAHPGFYQEFRAGDTLPFAARKIEHRNFVFPLDVDGTPRVLYLRLQSRNMMSFPLTISSQTRFTEYSLKVQLGLGVALGILLVMALYNLFLYGGLRDVSYLYYVIYLGGTGCYFLVFNGVGYQFLWPGSPWLQNIIGALTVAVAVAALCEFSRQFLNTAQLAPRLDRAFRIWCWLACAKILFTFVTPRNIGEIYLNVVLVIGSVPLVMYAGWRCLRLGYQPARYYLAAFAAVMLGALMLALANVGVLPDNAWTRYSVQVGAVLESVLLSLALANRINVMKFEKEAAQVAALQMAQQAERELEVKVDSRTSELTNANQQLSRSNQELSHAVAQLERLNLEKNEILGIAAHDLKNPLAAILSSVEVMEALGDTMNPQERQDDLSRIRFDVQRMMDIIGNLLNANAIETGTMTLQLETLDLAALTALTVNDYRPRAAAKSIALELQAAPAWVLADRSATLEVLDNLVSNAIKYSPPGRQVTVRCQATPRGALLAVRDQGPGIRADEHDKLFQKFSRLSAQPTGGENSTGLGLSIVKRLAEAMGGRVWCDSEPGAGATFWLELRARPE